MVYWPKPLPPPLPPPFPVFISVDLSENPSYQEICDGFLEKKYYELLVFYWKPQRIVTYVALLFGTIIQIDRYRRSQHYLRFRYSAEYLLEAGTYQPDLNLVNTQDNTIYRPVPVQGLATGVPVKVVNDKLNPVWGALNRKKIEDLFYEYAALVDNDPLHE